MEVNGIIIRCVNLKFMDRKYGSFTSVNNPEEFSKTWESVIKVLSLGLSLYLSYQGVGAAAAADIVQNNLQAFSLLGGAVIVSWEAKEAVFGAIRKLIAARNQSLEV